MPPAGGNSNAAVRGGAKGNSCVEVDEPSPSVSHRSPRLDTVRLREMEMALDDIICAARDIRCAPLDIVTAVPPHLAMEGILGRLEAAQLARCMCVCKAWRDRARGALARLRTLPSRQAIMLRRAAPHIADRVLRFFANHCVSLRDITVVGCCPSPASLRDLCRSNRSSLRRLELCIESGAVDPYSYDPFASSGTNGDVVGGGGGSGGGGGGEALGLWGAVVVDASAWADRDGIQSILAASGGGLKTLSLEMASRACAAVVRCAASSCPSLVALRLNANTLDYDDWYDHSDDDDDVSATAVTPENFANEGDSTPQISELIGHGGAERPDPPSAGDIVDMVNGRLDTLSKLFPPSLANTLVVLDLVYLQVAVDETNLADIFPALTHLRVVGYQCNTKGLLALVRRCPRLRALCLPFTRVTDDVCVAAAEQCPALEVLDVAEPERGHDWEKEPITDATLHAFARCAAKAHLRSDVRSGTGAGVRIEGGLRRLRYGSQMYGHSLAVGHLHDTGPPSPVVADLALHSNESDDSHSSLGPVLFDAMHTSGVVPGAARAGGVNGNGNGNWNRERQAAHDLIRQASASPETENGSWGGFSAAGLAAFAQEFPDCRLVKYPLESDHGHQWGMNFEREAEKAVTMAGG